LRGGGHHTARAAGGSRRCRGDGRVAKPSDGRDPAGQLRAGPAAAPAQRRARVRQDRSRRPRRSPRGHADGTKVPVAEVHDAVDLRRLGGRPASHAKAGSSLGPSISTSWTEPTIAAWAPRRRGPASPDESCPLLRELRRHGRGHRRRRRALLGGVDEAPDDRSASRRGSRGACRTPPRSRPEPDEHRRAERGAGDRVPQRGDDVRHAPPRHPAPHRAEHAVVGVLDRHVDVRERARPAELLDEAVRHVRRVEVEVAEPGDRGLREGEEKVPEVRAAGTTGQVLPPRERVLRDEHHFLDAVPRQRIDLGDHVGQRPAPVTAPHEGDRAEGAAHVAPLRDLHVRVRNPAETDARGIRAVHVPRRGARDPVIARVQPADHVHDAGSSPVPTSASTSGSSVRSSAP
jgi:hypothetical protein